MRRREFLGVIGVVASSPLVARVQPPAMPVIGFLSSITEPGRFTADCIPSGRERSRLFEGRNVAIEVSWAENHSDRLPALAADFVHRPVTVIAAADIDAALAAKSWTGAGERRYFAGACPAFDLLRSLKRSSELSTPEIRPVATRA